MCEEKPREKKRKMLRGKRKKGNRRRRLKMYMKNKKVQA
jgi:hypothetical protein